MTMVKNNSKSRWLPFNKAKKIVHSLNLKSETDWRKYLSSGNRPKNIPSNPQKVYKEFIDYADWCGYERKFTIDYSDYNLLLKILKQKFPNASYKYLNLEKIKSCNDKIKFLCPIHGHQEQSIMYHIHKGSGCSKCGMIKGVQKRKQEYLPFNDARIFARTLKLSSHQDWRKYLQSGKRPLNIPASPDRIYDEWKSWKDWLGTIDGFDGFLDFDGAKRVVHLIGLKNVKEWQKFCVSGNKPTNIPSNPSRTYLHSGWKDWGDFLGTNNDSSQKIKSRFLPFEEAKNFVRNLKLTGEKKYREWSKSNLKPDNIPSTPAKVYKDCGWTTWNDFLGTNRVSTTYLKRNFLPFEEARKFIRLLGLKNSEDYKNYCTSGKKPKNIPSNPSTVYKDFGWISIRDFIGVEKPSNYDKARDFLPYIEAREFVHALKLSSPSEWVTYLKSNKKPANIPATPELSYKNKGWVSYNDWLGVEEYMSTQNRSYLPYEEAKNIVRKEELKNLSDWKEWCKSDKRPLNIPTHPHYIYKDCGWTYYGDFLGTDRVASYNQVFFSFEDCKRFAQSLNLKNKSEWEEYWLSNDKPNDVPYCPDTKYAEWTCWADFLGVAGDGKHPWIKSNFIWYLKNTQQELNTLDSVELITIINSNNLSRKINQIGCLEDLISSEAHSNSRKKILKEIVDKIEGVNDTEIETEPDDDTVLQNKIIESEKDDTVPTELIPFSPIDELKSIDCKNLTISLDDENIEFLLKNKLNKLWYNVLNQKVDVEKLKWETGGNNFELIKQWFFEEYNAINEIQLPIDYNFRNQHGIIKPNFMQLLTAHRLLKEKSYGNWSDTGAGKTLSAILAGRIAGAKNTLIICNNATVEGWVKSIDEYFINNNIFVKHLLSDEIPKNIYKTFNKYNICLPGNANNYLVINYETFQQDDGEYIVHELLKNNVFNYIILDEVQNVKQREADKESNRRNVISKLLTQARTNNPDILTLAMTATPVINNLFEARMLIELLTGVEHKELNTSESIINGVEMYKSLTRHGLRYIPNYGITVNEETVTIDGYELKEQILNVANGDVVGFEKVLLPAKLEAMKDKIRKGTMIYTHYVTELIPTIQKFVEDLGYTVGLYTGVDKLGLSKFKKGQVDVLIGSAPVGTGVDGIQKVCNTLIPVCLPWTNSEWRQIKGRIDRQGSHFNHINIYIPEVVITTDNGEWSWDRRRFNIIRFKATLADLAVDGRVPNRLLPSKAKMMEDAKKELREWIQRLESGDFITFERSELKIPLNPELVKKEQRVHGDFSKMNQRWSVSNSKTTFERLQKSQDEWYYYHTLYSEKRKTWSEIPFIEIAKKIQTRPEWLVGDFGCGENLLAKELKNKVLAFDYVALNDSVTACDISNVPLSDNTLDVAVFSLSLMGDNYQEYLTEAYRVLKPHGTIFVAEPAEKWLGREHELKAALENVGFKCFNAVKNTGKFIYFDGMKY